MIAVTISYAIALMCVVFALFGSPVITKLRLRSQVRTELARYGIIDRSRAQLFLRVSPAALVQNVNAQNKSRNLLLPDGDAGLNEGDCFVMSASHLGSPTSADDRGGGGRPKK